MDNAATLVLGEEWTKGKESLELVNQEIAAVFGEDNFSEWIDYEAPYARIARKIIENSFNWKNWR